MQYIYPAIFEKEESGLYAVTVPDIDGCYTSGDNVDDAFTMALDVLCYCLYDLEREGKTPPAATNPADLKPPKNGFIAMLGCDITGYKVREKSKAVKKTLSIPQWLDERAVASEINFSRVLQDGLKKELNIQ